jgi:truncated hemoglobin YjbI
MSAEDWIFSVVDAFYQRARTDVLIGYHFRVIEDFESHIPRIAAFWEIQLLGQTPRDYGGPFDVLNLHRPLMIKPGELNRWLLLFRRTKEEALKAHPQFSSLSDLWEERLRFFEGVFLRTLGLKVP